MDTVLANRDIVVGIKVRLTADVSDNGKNEQEAYRCKRKSQGHDLAASNLYTLEEHCWLLINVGFH
jgi:hypothetical protein